MKARLTPRHKAFLRAYHENGRTNGAAAYLAAGFNCDPSYASQNAHKLLARPHIAEALEQLDREATQAAAVDLGITPDAVAKKFVDLRAKAESDKDWRTAITANIELAKIAHAYDAPSGDDALAKGQSAEVAAQLIATILSAILPVLTAHKVPAEPVKAALMAQFGLSKDKPQATSLH